MHPSNQGTERAFFVGGKFSCIASNSKLQTSTHVALRGRCEFCGYFRLSVSLLLLHFIVAVIYIYIFFFKLALYSHKLWKQCERMVDVDILYAQDMVNLTLLMFKI